VLYHNLQVMATYLRVVDALTVGGSVAAAWWVGAGAGLWPGEPASPALVLVAALSTSFVALCERLGVYRARRTQGIGVELAALLEVTALSFGVACLTSELFTPGFSGPTYMLLMAAAVTGLLGTRALARVSIRQMRKRGKDYRVWLLVGRNARSAALARTILSSPHFGIVIAECVDLERRADAPSDGRESGAESWVPGVATRLIIGTEEIRGILSSRVIDEVVVTLPVRSFYDEVQRILDICGEAGITVKLPPEGFRRARDWAEISHVGNVPMVSHFSGPSNRIHLAMKRLIDVIAATVGLVLLAPLLLAVGLAVLLTSRGPILFVQTRVGLHGRHFRMLKFRSMVDGADRMRKELREHNEVDGTAFKIREDPRCTPVGRFLRKHHLDELPQLVNVLLGDMSLVGPRPLPPEEAHGTEWWQRRRLSMPPGLTCHWQVQGGHRRMPFREWMKSDLAYIDNWSLTLDLRLIAATVGAVFRGGGW
jgi:exopolysaccharide biosynthesis polyprenyl glycosylphosphotransferase